MGICLMRLLPFINSKAGEQREVCVLTTNWKVEELGAETYMCVTSINTSKYKISQCVRLISTISKSF